MSLSTYLPLLPTQARTELSQLRGKIQGIGKENLFALTPFFFFFTFYIKMDIWVVDTAMFTLATSGYVAVSYFFQWYLLALLTLLWPSPPCGILSNVSVMWVHW